MSGNIPLYHNNMADFYKQGSNYFTTTGQKVANPTELQSLAKAGGKEVAMPTVPEGATKIAGPSGLQGLNESQLFRQGQDIYKLPTIDTTLDPTVPTPDVPEPEQVNDVSGYMAGLDTTTKGLEAILKQINQPPKQEEQITERQKRVDELAETQAGIQETALPKAEEFGYTKYTKELQSIMPQIAKLKAEYDNIAEENLNRPISSRIIGGTADRIARQKAVELTGLSAIAQAYQGNIQLATQTAQEMIEMELAPSQTRIDNQKWQIEQLEGQMTDEQARKASSLELILEERQREIDEIKERKTNIAKIGLQAAEGGASQSEIDRIFKAESYEEAIKLARRYINQQETPDGLTDLGDGTFYDEDNDVIITEEQINSSVIIPESSRLAYVNNNPGNLRFVGQEGAVQGEGGFAKFSSPEAGYQALKRQIELDKSRNLTLRGFISKYAPPSENDTELYIQQATQALGVSEGTKINDIDTNSLAQFMAKKESGTVIRNVTPTEPVSDFDTAMAYVQDPANADKTPTELKNDLLAGVASGQLDLSVTEINSIVKQKEEQIKQEEQQSEPETFSDEWFNSRITAARTAGLSVDDIVTDMMENLDKNEINDLLKRNDFKLFWRGRKKELKNYVESIIK